MDGVLRGTGGWHHRLRLLHRRTVWLRTLYLLAFIELGSRRIFVSPSTAHPDAAWVTQQARNLALGLDDRSTAIRFLIRDRETKFSRAFDAVVRSEGVTVILTAI